MARDSTRDRACMRTCSRASRALTSLHTLRVARSSTRDGDVCACMIALLRRRARTLGLPARSCSLNRSRWGSGDVGRSRGCNLFRIRGQPGTAATGAWDSFRRSRGRVQTHLPMPGRAAAGCVASGEGLNSPSRVYVYMYTHTKRARLQVHVCREWRGDQLAVRGKRPLQPERGTASSGAGDGCNHACQGQGERSPDVLRVAKGSTRRRMCAHAR